MNKENNYNELIGRGFTVIPGFFSPDEISMFISDYYNQANSVNENYYLKFASNDVARSIEDKIINIVNQVRETTGISATIMSHNLIFMDSSKSNFDWHQDHETWYVDQHNDNYLNFYIPLIKPDPVITGVTLIPYDNMDRVLPEFAARFKGSGAKRLSSNGDVTHVWNDDTGEEYDLPVNINSLGVSPAIEAGDLLLLRGDLIHKTQDNITNRLAITIRCLNSNHVVSKIDMMSGCQVKMEYIQNNLKVYNDILEIYGDQDTITVGELYKNNRVFK